MSFRSTPSIVHVDEHGRAGKVPVPDVVMDDLEVPQPVAGVDVHGDDGVREEVVAVPVAAVVVVGRHLGRQVDDAELEIRADLPPDSGVAGVAPRVVQPTVVAEFVRARDRVEDPLAGAGVGVEAADVPLGVPHRARRAPGDVRRADDDRVAGHERGGVQPDLAGQRIDLLIHVLHQVDDAVLAKARETLARPGVQADQPVARRDVEDLAVAAVVAIGQPAAGPAPRRHRGPLPLVEPVHPEQLAGPGVHRDRRPAQTGRRVEDPADHQRRRLEVELRLRPEVRRLHPPGDFQVVEVPGRDLVERGIPRVRDIASITAPLPVVGLRRRRRCTCREQSTEHDDPRDAHPACRHVLPPLADPIVLIPFSPLPAAIEREG